MHARCARRVIMLVSTPSSIEATSSRTTHFFVVGITSLEAELWISVTSDTFLRRRRWRYGYLPRLSRATCSLLVSFTLHEHLLRSFVRLRDVGLLINPVHPDVLWHAAGYGYESSWIQLITNFRNRTTYRRVSSYLDRIVDLLLVSVMYPAGTSLMLLITLSRAIHLATAYGSQVAT